MGVSTKVPFLDLNRSHQPLMEELREAFERVAGASAFIGGDAVTGFEREFAEYVGVRHCVGLSSGLDAEVIGLRSLGLKKDQPVVVPALTFIATAEAVHQAGGLVELVDVGTDGLIDLNALEDRFKSGVRFALPVHLFGQLVDPKGLKALSQKYGAEIMEDACQAHGARIGGVSAGQIGRASAFSFYPGKNLGAFGDAGALCTDDESVARTARALREHGQTAKNEFTYEGYTARLDALQAAILSVKLPHLPAWNKSRMEIGRRYFERLAGLQGGRLQSSRQDGGHVYHLVVLITEQRDRLVQALKEAEIGFGFHYPVPLHRMPCYSKMPWFNGSFPNAEAFASNGISLPVFPGMTESEVDHVADVVRRSLDG